MNNRIKFLRELNNLTQKELADKAKIGYRTISDYERGVSTPDADALKNLAKVFNVSTDYLLGITNEKLKESNPTDDINLAFYNQHGIVTDAQKEEIESFIEFIKSKSKQ